MSDWRKLDHKTLEREYNARATVPDVDAELRAYRAVSDEMYQRLPHRRGLRYGPGTDETLDLFPVPGQPDAPLFLFIHGGYWRALCKDDSVFMAQNFNNLGVAVAALDYSLALGADTRRMVVAGSSAGAHLAAMVLASGWQARLGVPDDTVRGGVLVSGLYDLAPLCHALPQSWLNLNESDVLALSPQHHLPERKLALHVVAAQRDTGARP